MLKCHYSATVFVVPDQILQVDSDLMEKYCNKEKALHAMFGQHCLPGAKYFQGPGNSGHQGPALPLNQSKVHRIFLPSPLPWFSCKEVPSKMIWKELEVRTPARTEVTLKRLE